MPYLDVFCGDEKRAVPLSGEPVTIGRSSTNVICINDGQASRAHCVVERMVEGYRLRDLDSRNGTWCAGERVENVLLADKTEFRIGAARFVFHAGKPPV